MKTNILLEREYSLKSSIHTFMLKTECIPQERDLIRLKETGYLNAYRIKPEKNSCYFIFNLNRQGDIFSYKDFGNTLLEVLMNTAIEDYKISRIDLRFDTYKKQHFEMFYKIHKYLILAFAICYNAQNTYDTKNLRTLEKLSLSVKKKYFEMEVYNRAIKSIVTGNIREKACTRLELRSKSLNIPLNNEKIKNEFLVNWCQRLDKAYNSLEQAEDEMNRLLVNEFYTNKLSIKDFVLTNQDIIFTEKQLIDLLSMLNESNPKNRAQNLKKRYKIDFISDKNILYVIGEIKRSMEVFFNS